MMTRQFIDSHKCSRLFGANLIGRDHRKHLGGIEGDCRQLTIYGLRVVTER